MEHRAGGVPSLAVSELRVVFGGITAVSNVSLVVESGQIVGLIGSNGAGKSTLMNAIGGFVTASGSVRLGDPEIGDRAPSSRAALGLGRTFQSATLFPVARHRDAPRGSRGERKDGGALDGARTADRTAPEPARPVRRRRSG